MTPSPLPAWGAIAVDARLSDPSACSSRADSFGRKIRRRNIVEYIVGGLVACLFAGGTVATASAGEWPIAIILASFVPAIGFVLWYLKRRGGYEAPRFEEPCRLHLRRSLEKQRGLLANAWLWYVGPFLPGSVALFAYVTWRVADKVGWSEAIEGVLWPATFTFGIFALVAALNGWGARRLDREIAELDFTDEVEMDGDEI